MVEGLGAAPYWSPYFSKMNVGRPAQLALSRVARVRVTVTVQWTWAFNGVSRIEGPENYGW